MTRLQRRAFWNTSPTGTIRTFALSKRATPEPTVLHGNVLGGELGGRALRSHSPSTAPVNPSCGVSSPFPSRDLPKKRFSSTATVKSPVTLSTVLK